MRSIESRPVEIALGNGKLYILCRSMPSTAHYAAVCRSSILCRNIMPASDRKPKLSCCSNLARQSRRVLTFLTHSLSSTAAAPLPGAYREMGNLLLLQNSGRKAEAAGRAPTTVAANGRRRGHKCPAAARRSYPPTPWEPVIGSNAGARSLARCCNVGPNLE